MRSQCPPPLGSFPTMLSMSRSNALDRRNSGGGISGTANADNGPIREGTEIPGKALLELCYRLAGSQTGNGQNYQVESLSPRKSSWCRGNSRAGSETMKRPVTWHARPLMCSGTASGWLVLSYNFYHPAIRILAQCRND